MVDLQATNSKLTERSKRIVCKITNVAPEEAADLLQRCNGELKTAIVSHRLDLAARTSSTAIASDTWAPAAGT